jgi:hypothetical protein
MSGGQPSDSLQLHICAITNAGKLLHTSRTIDTPGATWSQWEEVKPPGTSNSGPFSSVACIGTRRDVEGTSTDKELHILGITPDGRLLHTSRLPQHDWQPFDDLGARIGGSKGKFQAVGGNELRGVLDICVIAHTEAGPGRILHTSRGLNGTWDSFQDVNALTDSPETFISVDCVTIFPLIFTTLHICGVSSDGKLWHALRFTDSQWLPFADAQFLSANAPSSFANVGIAARDSAVDVCAQARGDIWHTMRFSADPSQSPVAPPHWQAAFDDVEKQAGHPGAFGSVSCAVVGEQLHVCGVTQDGKLRHTFRTSANPPAWRPFEEVTTGAANPGSFKFVCITGDPPWWGPIGGGGDPTCVKIQSQIADATFQLGTLQRQGTSTSNSARVKGLQQQIANLRQRERDHHCS